MYFGTTSLSDKFSIHTEAQLRLYETINNFNQFLPRVGINYHISEKAIATGGFALIPTETYEKDEPFFSKQLENRTWQQFILKNKVGRLSFEHRYRLEQRWVSINENPSIYLDRARYRIFLSIPLNKKSNVPGALSLKIYDEVFLNLHHPVFSQNRLYFALGYKLSDQLSFQAGYLRNHIGTQKYNRLQFAVLLNNRLSIKK